MRVRHLRTDGDASQWGETLAADEQQVDAELKYVTIKLVPNINPNLKPPPRQFATPIQIQSTPSVSRPPIPSQQKPKKKW